MYSASHILTDKEDMTKKGKDGLWKPQVTQTFRLRISGVHVVLMALILGYSDSLGQLHSAQNETS